MGASHYRVHTEPSLDNAANAAVAQLLRTQLAEGRQEGVAVAAYLNGKLIVSCWAGEGVSDDSLFMAASVSKGCVATVLAVLSSRGLLDYTARVSSVWPAFAQAGKQNITVEQVRVPTCRCCTNRRALTQLVRRPSPTAQGCAPELLASFVWRAW
jgi:CubicO group peptidase (beta-lactamase class C family)